MTSPIFTRVPSCTPSHSSRPVALVDTDALRHAETRPVALSRVTVAVGYAVVTVAISTEAGALAERIAIATTMTTSTAAPIVHLLIQRCRRRGANDFDSRSMESFERSGVDTLRPCDKSGTNYSGCSPSPLGDEACPGNPLAGGRGEGDVEEGVQGKRRPGAERPRRSRVRSPRLAKTRRRLRN